MPKNNDGTFTLCGSCATRGQCAGHNVCAIERMPVTYSVTTAYDADADLSWLENGGPVPTDPEYVAHSAARLASYGDEWHMVGVIVTATRNGEEIDCTSLWGIESDSGEEYITHIVADLKAELAGRIGRA